MNSLNKLVLWIKSIFHKKEKIKMIEEPRKQLDENKKANFIESIRINIAEKKKKRIHTPVCSGDGLGIQKKLNY